MYENTRDKIVNFILNKGTGYADLFDNDPQAKAIYIEECRKYLCDCYLDNDMTKKQREEFVEMLSWDRKLRKELLFRCDINQFLKEEAALLCSINNKYLQNLSTCSEEEVAEQVKKILDKLDQQLKQEEDIGIRKTTKMFNMASMFRKGNWVAAASIAILFVFTVWNTIKPLTENTHADLFAEYYQPFEESGSLTVNSGNQQNATNGITNAAFRNSIGLMEKGLFNDAARGFEDFLTANPKSEFISQANWYLALCYIKINRTSEAKRILERIVETKSDNYREAKQVLKDLRSKKLNAPFLF